MQLKIKFKYHLHLMFCQSYFLIALGLFLLLSNFDRSSWLICSIIAPILFLPAIYLHLEYYFQNRGEELILEQNNLVFIDKQQDEHLVNFSEITRIILYISGDLEGRRLGQVLPNANYHYVRIITNSKNEIIITNLMYPNLYKVINNIEGVKIEIKRRLFCTVLRK